MSRIVVLLLLVFACGAPPSTPSAPTLAYDAERGLLVVFVQPGASDLADAFESDDLPAILALADDAGIATEVVDARDGAPDEVAITPLLVYQNHRGRSIFQGRYANGDRIRNFLRTARRVPQREDPLVREDVARLRLGRVQLAAPVKVSPVTGAAPDGYDDAAFQAEARAAIAAGLQRFAFVDRVALGRADRSFYMDFYPYRAEDGTLYLSAVLFSQFHCKEPVWRTALDAPIAGPWAERGRLFAEAAERMEAACLDLLATSTLGDGFDPVADAVPARTWEALGLALPARPESAAAAVGDVTLGRRWRLAPSDPGDPPALQFRFAAPLEAYVGEVGVVSGELVLGDGLAVAGSEGWVDAEARSVTMGIPDLDRMLHGSSTLDADAHPTARLSVRAASADPAAPDVAFGRQTRAAFEADFSMKGLTVPVAVDVLVEPVLGDDGAPRLSVSGGFEIRLKDPFGIIGAPGPAPANDTVVFDFVLELTAAPES